MLCYKYNSNCRYIYIYCCKTVSYFYKIVVENFFSELFGSNKFYCMFAQSLF